MTIPCPEGGLVDVFLFNPYLMVSLLGIYLSKYPFILQVIEEIINPW
jgi:hypothetical protein